jgi:hypothetical protein
MSDRLQIRPATAADVKGFYPAGLGSSVRAWVAEVDGEVRGIAGVLATGEYLLVFSDIKDAAGLPKLTIWRGTRALMEKITALNLPLIAVANDCSGPFLERLGFIRTVDEGVFAWLTR